MNPKKPKRISTRVTFLPADHLAVTQAARKSFMSFNRFVSELAVLAAKRVLEAEDESAAARIVNEILPASSKNSNKGSPSAAA